VRDLAAAQRVLVAHWQSGVAGFLGLLGQEVTSLYIAAAQRRHGLGSHLLGRARELARGDGQERLRVYTTAFSAVGFYERSGFHATGEITIANGPCHGRTAIHLVLPLA
jgi:GNAT superfamily N-acetyltransferase